MRKKKNKPTPEIKKFNPPGFIPTYGFLFDRAEELRDHQTQSERNFGRFLKQINVECYPQLPVYVGKNAFIVDFAFRSQSLKKWFACEIDGGYHKTDEQKKKDESRDAKLLVAGWIPLRMTNKDTNSPVKFAKLMLRYKADDIAMKISSRGKNK